tara:strand:+ start:3016 stop:3384 length:369 start_codon:yes stop_codon:yes gene_type:complete
LPNTGLLLPYTAQSPTLKRAVEYKGKGDIFDEIDRILSEDATQRFGVGQSLYYQLPFFCEPLNIIPRWCWDMIEDYHLATSYNIPLSPDLESINAWTADCFLIIEGELNNIRIHKGELNARS